MAIHWQIKFHSLRADTQYTVNIYDSTYSGSNPIQLKGGAQPFMTQEDTNDDPFCPVRKQSGSIHIVDDGLDANGHAWDWRTIVPMTDTARPVTLTNSTGMTLWHGFMQAQNYGGVLYGNPQEREFPVQCCLSVLGAIDVDYQQSAIQNFAYLLNYIIGSIPTLNIDNVVIQGGSDAQAWLLKKFDWNNFVTEDEDGVFSARYKLDQVLSDFCQFWGWTARTFRRTLYLTCADDTAETSFLTLTRAQLETMAGGSTAGTTGGAFTTIPLTGDIFASTSNDDFQQRGPSKVTVKADVNANDRVVKVFPKSVEKDVETNGWRWVQEQGEDLVGYFETVKHLTSFNSTVLSGGNYSNYCYFSRRQIYTSKESDAPVEADMIVFKDLTGSPFPYISLQTKKAMAFAGGSLILGGTIYTGARVTTWNELTRLQMRLGIGMTRSTARWWYMNTVDTSHPTISYGWSNPGSPGVFNIFYAGVIGGSIKSTALPVAAGILFIRLESFNAIPVPNEANLYGYLFVDFGDFSSNDVDAGSFEIADFTVNFSRDTIVLPTTLNEVRGREVKEERVTSKEYKATNNTGTGMEWNADCIYASDNNMKYGYGLLMNADGTFLDKVAYNGTNEHPEQHLANRVSNYWQQSKRMVSPDLRYNEMVPITGGTFALKSLTPQYKVTLDGSTFYPIAFSNNWRDDTMKLTLLQM